MDILVFREKIIEGLLAAKNDETNLDVDTEDDNVNDSANDNQSKKKRKRGKSTHRINRYEGSARTSRKRCGECYKNIQKKKGSKEARAKASKVLTFCEDCDGKPAMCIPCFKKFHE